MNIVVVFMLSLLFSLSSTNFHRRGGKKARSQQGASLVVDSLLLIGISTSIHDHDKSVVLYTL